MDDPTDPSLTAALNGRYMLEEQIGSGSLGVVFRARHLHIDKVHAVKLLHRDLARDRLAYERFIAETRVTSQVRHLNVVEVDDFGEVGRALYLVMKLVDGLRLDQLVKEQGPLALPRIGHIGSQICEAVAAAHDKKVAHGGLTPSKVLVSVDGTDQVTVIGFRSETEDAQSDQRALGAVLYTLATGRRPIHFQRPALPSTVTPLFAEVIHRMLATSPDEQYPTVRAAAEALQTAARDAPA